jgi:hypothetical protein
MDRTIRFKDEDAEFMKDFASKLAKERKTYDENDFLNELNKLLAEEVYLETIIADRRLADWYLFYKELKNQEFEKKNIGKRIAKGEIPYPWKSKASKFLKTNPKTILETPTHDPIITKKALKRIYKPTFSKFFGSWEIDLVFNLTGNMNDIHLFCINVNTRYLFVEKMQNKTEIIAEMTKIFVKCNRLNEKYNTDRFAINHLKGDGDRSFISRSFTNFLNARGISTYFSSSPFTEHNKIVDAVIRTIRDAIGYRRITDKQLQQVVKYYNNTIHRTIGCTPLEMMLNEDYEAQYIRWNIDKLIEVSKKLPLYYKPGNILLLHCELGKTRNSFEKRRKFWDRVGEFLEYSHGNVVVRLLRDQPLINNKNILELPIHYTKYIAKDLRSIPESYTRVYTI